MARIRVLFQGSLDDPSRQSGGAKINEDRAREFAADFGRCLMEHDLDLMLIDPNRLEDLAGEAAVEACNSRREDPNERIRTYVYSDKKKPQELFGMVLPAKGGRRWREGRQATVMEADALVALAGGRTTADTLQKAQLVGIPVFPVPYAGGAAKEELERLRMERSDLDFLAAMGQTPADIVRGLASYLMRRPGEAPVSKRIFIVHGHDDGLKNDVARLLTQLGFVPVVLREQVDTGRTLFNKLHEELSDIGFALVLLTPDDFGRGRHQSEADLKSRARQNVVFEYGWMVGSLGPKRVCAVVKGDVEFPSDLMGITHKKLEAGQDFSSIALAVVKELKEAGYEVDANVLLSR